MTDKQQSIESLNALDRGAEFGSNQKFRYKLWRTKPWSKGRVGFIMLNPSTADVTNDDPTVTRCLKRALKMGYDGIEVGNLYAFRATDPAELKSAGYPVGPLNDEAIRLLCRQCEMVILGWGNHAQPERAAEVLALVTKYNDNVYHLGLNKSGQPKHPLYIGYDVEPIRYEV